MVVLIGECKPKAFDIVAESQLGMIIEVFYHFN